MMNGRMPRGLLVVSFALVFVLCPSTGQGAGEPALRSGRYRVNANNSGSVVTLKVSGSTFSGTSDGGTTVTKGTISGNAVTFHLVLQSWSQGQDYKGTIKGNKITGTFTGAPYAIGAAWWPWEMDLTDLDAKPKPPTPPPTAKPAAPLHVSVNSTASMVKVGEVVKTRATVAGGTPDYRYEWYDGSRKSAVTKSGVDWTVKTTGEHVYKVVVYDKKQAKAEASVTVHAVGKSVPTPPPTKVVPPTPPPTKVPTAVPPLADRLLSLKRPTQMSPNGVPAPGGSDGVKTGGFGFQTAAQDHPWWTVDLGSDCMLSEVRVFNSMNYKPYEAKYFQVRLSSNGTSWVNVYTHDGSNPGSPTVVKLFNKIARYVRIELKDQNVSLHLDEVEVYGHQASR
jgi:hypothetical protein